jgi:ribulose-phosphate 3-epimerase
MYRYYFSRCNAYYLLGAGGQKFMERCVPKVAELRERFPEIDIEVDGGVSPKNIDVCAHAGEPHLAKGISPANWANPDF